MKKTLTGNVILAIGLILMIMLPSIRMVGQGHAEVRKNPSTLMDLSGLAWINDDLFMCVHDAKNGRGEKDWPRISLLELPLSGFDGVIRESVYMEFPGFGGLASDLESICRIPGGKDFLLAESGQAGEDHRRIFHAVYEDGGLAITEYVAWPVPVTNVEATEVCRINDRLVFLYAERAEGSKTTQLRWADLSLNPLGFGAFSEVTYVAMDPVGQGARPVVAMDIDSDGTIYIASAYDPGIDNGPFRSVIWQIGRVTTDEKGNPLVVLESGKRLATLDGLKVESIAIRELPGQNREIFFGTDDENYGGIIRLLPSVK